MKRVDTDKKRVSTMRKRLCLRSRKLQESDCFGCENWETTEGLRTDSPTGDVNSHNSVRSWCAQARVFIHSCDFTNGYFQGQEIDRILLYRIPAEGIPEGVAGGEILASLMCSRLLYK